MKATVGFGFRSVIEITCRNFNEALLDEINQVFKKSINKEIKFLEPRQIKQFNKPTTLIVGHIQNLERYLTPEEQEALINNLKDQDFGYKDIS